MEDKIRTLQRRAAALEPDAAQRAALMDGVQQHAQAFYERLPEAPAYTGSRPASGPLESPPAESATPLPEVLDLLTRDVDGHGINPASGGHLGYIPGGGIYTAALGDYLAAVMNRYSGVMYASPGAVRIEKRLLEWIGDLIGYPAGAAGDLTSGGSIANLVGIVTARDAHGLSGRELPATVVYSTAQVHHCVDKALRIAGLRECVRRIVPMDERYRMDASALAAAIDQDKRNGLRPWLVIASAGTTDVGAVDPLEDIAAIARAHELWLHIDAAYGGFFVLTGAGAKLLRGMDRSDSIVLDPHKGLFLPYGSGAVLVRDAALLHQAHYYEANYMQDTKAVADDLSPADLGPELSRHFRGMRMWLPLKLAGLAPFRAALEEKLALARYFYERLGAMPGFWRGPRPELSVVTYRYVPERGDAAEFNRRLVEAVRADGRVFLSSTQLDGEYVLRAAILCLRTHLDHVEVALDLLAHHARRLADLG